MGVIKATVPQFLEAAKRAVVRVGYGRGFIVSATGGSRYVVTAAHCLPHSRLPPPHLANGPPELTFPKIIGLLANNPTIWAELCVFSLNDDVAAFTAPDSQDLYARCDEYKAFTEVAITIGKPPTIVAPHARVFGRGTISRSKSVSPLALSGNADCSSECLLPDVAESHR